MSMTLKSIPATVAPDGSVTLSEPLDLHEPASAMVTIAIASHLLAIYDVPQVPSKPRAFEVLAP